MTQLFHVYDPKGEAFEVRPDVAKNLVINEGWSLDPPLPKYVEPVRDLPAPPLVVALVKALEPETVPEPVQHEPVEVHVEHHDPVAVNAQSDEARS